MRIVAKNRMQVQTMENRICLKTLSVSHLLHMAFFTGQYDSRCQQ